MIQAALIFTVPFFVPCYLVEDRRFLKKLLEQLFRDRFRQPFFQPVAIAFRLRQIVDLLLYRRDILLGERNGTVKHEIIDEWLAFFHPSGKKVIQKTAQYVSGAAADQEGGPSVA